MVTGDTTSAERVRLHITPFKPELLDKFLTASLRSQATNISFHTIETFPERGFGYVDLPAMEAQKLKKKFNGTTLKGAKVRVEDAKVAKKRKSDQIEAVEEDHSVKKHKRETRSSKLDKGVIPGHELEKGRQVKRGWVDNVKPGQRKDKHHDSKSLKDKKMRFKTTLPPNVAATEAKPKKQVTKAKDSASRNKKTSVVVNEFAKSSKMTSKAIASGKRAVIYEDGKGWLDEAGNVVEAGPRLRQRQRNQQPIENEKRANSESEASSVAEDDSSVNDQEDGGSQSGPEHSSSGSSSEDDSDAEESPSSEAEALSDLLVDKPVGQIPQIAVSESNDVAKEIHPLEALYKRPKPAATDASTSKKPAPINTSFNFFDSKDDGHLDAGDHYPQLPQTPHTKKDLEWRSLRSAAPTPDTALPGKRFSFGLADEDDEMEEDVPVTHANDTIMAMEEDSYEGAADDGAKEGRGEESEFRKWFYENRGDLNRVWKKRRREEKKLLRQRENRRLSNKKVA